MDNNQLDLAVRNLEVAKEGLLPSKAGEKLPDVSLFESAMNQPTIAYSHSDLISNALKICFLKLGIRAANLPTQEEKSVIMDFIYRNYANHTPKEIVLAFDLAITGKLDTDVKHYENFTCMYLGTVMAAYRKWAVEQSKMIKHKPMLIENNAAMTEDEMQEWVNDWVAKDRYDMEILPLPFYDHLVNTGRINLTSKEKWVYTEKATTQIKVRLQDDMGICKTNDAYIAYRKFQDMEKDGFVGEMKGRILNRAKRLIIRDYIASVKNV